MQEKSAQRRKRLAPVEAPPVPTPEPVRPARAVAEVRVTSGVFDERMRLEGMTVGAVVAMLRPTLNLAPGVAALVDGRRVHADHVLRADEALELVRLAGERG